MRVVIYGPDPTEHLLHLNHRVPSAEIRFATDTHELSAALGPAEVLVVAGAHYDATVARIIRDEGASLRVVQSTAAGVDRMLQWDLPQDLILLRGGGLWDRPMAEHAMSLILGLARQVVEMERLRVRREWAKWEVDSAIQSLEGKTLGIVGCGSIGLDLARKAKAFDMQVWGLARRPRTTSEALDVDMWFSRSRADLHDMLSGIDVLTVLLPLTAGTQDFISDPELRLMKPTSLVVNMSRGGVLSERALVEALEQKWIRAAALDVFEQEPLPVESPLWGLENIIISPHVGGATELRSEKVADLVAENLRRHMAGEPLLYEVDRKLGY